MKPGRTVASLCSDQCRHPGKWTNHYRSSCGLATSRPVSQVDPMRPCFADRLLQLREIACLFSGTRTPASSRALSGPQGHTLKQTDLQALPLECRRAWGQLIWTAQRSPAGKRGKDSPSHFSRWEN